MTAVTEAALARLRASIQKSSSMKLSLAGNAVPCTRNTSRPRTFSRTRTNRFPSENRRVSVDPRAQPRYSAIDAPSVRLADPANSRNSSVGTKKPNLVPLRPMWFGGRRLAGLTAQSPSPLSESNRRHQPYHGCALPTELRGQSRPGAGCRPVVVGLPALALAASAPWPWPHYCQNPDRSGSPPATGVLPPSSGHPSLATPELDAKLDTKR